MDKSVSEKKQQKKRDVIIEKTTELIVDKGVENTSLADIAREVGISKGTLYYYYSTKNDLIFDVTERHMARITERILSFLDKNKDVIEPANLLRMVFETMLKAETRSRLHLYLIREALSGNELLKKRFRKKYQEWYCMVEERFQEIMQDDVDRKALTRIIVATIDGFVIQSMLGIDDLPINEIAEFIDRMNSDL